MTPERRSEIEMILDHMNYSWTRRESDAIRDLIAEIDRLHEAEWNAQRDRTLAEGHQMRYDALVETMRRMGEEGEAMRAAILDIDAHATGYGVGDDDAIHHYIISAGSLHRALGLVGHTAPKKGSA